MLDVQIYLQERLSNLVVQCLLPSLILRESEKGISVGWSCGMATGFAKLLGPEGIDLAGSFLHTGPFNLLATQAIIYITW